MGGRRDADEIDQLGEVGGRRAQPDTTTQTLRGELKASQCVDRAEVRDGVGEIAGDDVDVAAPQEASYLRAQHRARIRGAEDAYDDRARPGRRPEMVRRSHIDNDDGYAANSSVRRRLPPGRRP